MVSNPETAELSRLNLVSNVMTQLLVVTGVGSFFTRISGSDFLILGVDATRTLSAQSCKD